MPVTDAHLEMDSLDNPHVAWLNADGHIYFTVRSSDGQWSEPALVSLDSPVVDMDFDMSNDQAHVIWLDGTAIRYRRQFEGDVMVFDNKSRQVGFNHRSDLSRVVTLCSG